MANPTLRWQLENLRMRLRLGRDLGRQVGAVLNWINTAALPENRILVEFPGYRRRFCFEFPLRHGDSPKALRQNDREPTLIIRTSNHSNPVADGTCLALA